MLVLGEGDAAVALVSVDTLFIGRTLTAVIVEACAARFGLPPERVLALASHTHFAPMIDEFKPGLGQVELSEVDRLGQVIKSAIEAARSEPITSMRVGKGHSDRAVNRRRRWRWPTAVKLLGKAQGDIYLAENPSGPRDRRIKTCVWISPEGRPIAAFWSFACHPVSFPDPDTASGDYISVVREALRRRLGAQVPVIFAPGCMGDLRPRSAAAHGPFRTAVGLAIYGPAVTPFDRPGWDAWAEGLADEVVAIDAMGEAHPVEDWRPAARMVRMPMSAIFEGSVPTPELHGKSVQVPGVGRIVALSCEPVTAIARLVAGSEDDLVLGYEGDVFGYLPTEAMIAEGGYESRGFLSPFGLEGDFKPGLDEHIAGLGRALREVR